MSQISNVFQGNIADIKTIDIDTLFTDIREPIQNKYFDVLNTVLSSGKIDQKHYSLYHFLIKLVSMHLKPDTPETPFGPQFQFTNGRSLVPIDLTDDDILAIKEINDHTNDRMLKSRLLDLLWVIKKDHNACKEAAEIYLQMGVILNTDDSWTYAEIYFRRALQLAKALGRSKELYVNISDSIQDAVRDSSKSTKDYHCLKFMEILLEFNIGDPVEYVTIAGNIADKALNDCNMCKARDYFKLQADWYHCLKDDEKEQAARLRAAMTYITEAEQRITGQSPSYAVASEFIKRAIEGMRRHGGVANKIVLLKAKLNEYQKLSHKEMKAFGTNLDLTDCSREAINHVKSRELPDAIRRLAFIVPTINISELKDTVKDMDERFVFGKLAPITLVDDAGRTITSAGSSLYDEARRFELSMYSYAAQNEWTIRAVGYIDPARTRILSEHHPTFNDLAYIVRDNPFIPPGHEEIFLRGIHAGFHSDFLTAALFLVPQIENSIRYVLDSNGVYIANLESDGTQPLKVLGPLFDLPETQEIFGESIYFELKGHLLEKAGYNFRNRIAHGYATAANITSYITISIWWLVLRLCFTPLQKPASKS